MGGSDFGQDTRLRIALNSLTQVLERCYQPGFTPSQLEEPLNKLVGMAPAGASQMLRETAQNFVVRASESANPNEAALAVADFLDQCFQDNCDPRLMRPSFDRVLTAFRGSPKLHERLYAAIVGVADRADGLDVKAQKRDQELMLRLRGDVEEHFLRSERAHMLVQQLHKEAQSGQQKTDAMTLPGVTWYEPDSGRAVRKALVLDKAVGPLIERTVVQLKRRLAYVDLGIRAPGRILMDGPPGTGKTMCARYIAHLLKMPCAVMRLDEIVGKLIGDTAKNVTAVLEAAVARRAVLFLDEVDGLFPPRDGDLTGSGGEELRRITSAFLQQVNMLPGRQIVICATNRPDALDTAFLRRFPDRISFSFPDPDTRREIAKRTWKKLVFTPAAHQALVEATEGTSGDHVTVVAMAAARIALDLVLDDVAAMAEVVAAATETAAARIAEAEAHEREERAANPGQQVPDMPDDASDAQIEEARAALEADRGAALERAKKAALRAATRKSRNEILRVRVSIEKTAVDQAVRDNPAPVAYLARDRSGRIIPMPDMPKKLTSSILHLPG